jgi:hypothetical protein
VNRRPHCKGMGESESDAVPAGCMLEFRRVGTISLSSETTMVGEAWLPGMVKLVLDTDETDGLRPIVT